MCVLHFGQIVEVAAELISCFALQSKHSMTELWCLLQKPSSFRKRDGSDESVSTGSSLAWSRTTCFDDETGRLQVSLQGAARLQFATFAHGDVAAHFAIHSDGFCFDLALDVGVLADRQYAVGINFTFDLAVNEQLFLEFNRAFDL